MTRRRLFDRGADLASILLAALALAAALLFDSSLQVDLSRSQIRAAHLERQLEDLIDQEHQLRMQAAYLESPAEIGRRAQEELGMRAPDARQIDFLASRP
jgi:cell division protein FtsL